MNSIKTIVACCKRIRAKSVSTMLMFLGAGMFLYSCNSQPENGADAIRKQISDYKAQINTLTLKVNELERELETMGESSVGRNRISVEVSRIEEGLFDQTFRTTATLEAVQAAMISPETSGQIKDVLVSRGQMVRQGQVLARLNTQVIENNISELKTSLALAETVYERQKRLWAQQIGSEIQYLEARNNLEALQLRLKTLQAQMDMSVMKAPFPGIVDDIFLKTGELAMPGVRVMHLVNLDRLYVNADVSEAFSGRVRPGSMVSLRFPAFPGTEMNVPVSRVGNTIHPENRTFQVQLIISNPENRYKPNMMASVGIVTKSETDAISIPSILIRQDIQGHFVFVAEQVNGDFIARKTYIERGPDGEGKTLITSGLNAGDQLIVRGQNQVNDGSLIRIVEPGQVPNNL